MAKSDNVGYQEYISSFCSIGVIGVVDTSFDKYFLWTPSTGGGAARCAQRLGTRQKPETVL